MNSQKNGTSAGPEKDAFLFRCLKALEIARTAQMAIEAEQAHAVIRLREEELAVEVIQGEIEDIRSRHKTATFQVIDMERTLRSFGIILPMATVIPMFTAKEMFDQVLVNAFDEVDQPFRAGESSHHDDLHSEPACPPSSPTGSAHPRSPRSPPSSPPPASPPPTQSPNAHVISPSQKSHTTKPLNTPP